MRRRRSFCLAGVLLVGALGGCRPAEPLAYAGAGAGEEEDVRAPAECTITGTSRDDVLRGTAGDDQICGLGGNDVLLGRQGADILLGGPGSDAGFGGGGGDQIRGGAGIDLLDGGPGRDSLRGGPADDRCPIGPGDRSASCSPPPRDPVIAAAGDIACPPGANPSEGSCQQGATSDLLVERDEWTVLTLGDNQYEGGELQDYQLSYAASWGRVKAITRPAPGNHDYHVPGAAGYYAYFGPLAGHPDQGYYSFDIGSWHLIALNSNCDAVGGCNAGSPQVEWLATDLAATTSTCTLAYWHHPRFSSGEHGNNDSYDAFWDTLFDAGADIVLNGHDHTYERFAPQDPDQRADPNGIREFVVGTGGKSHYGFPTSEPNSQARNSNTFGVLELTLHDSSYDWSFVPVAGSNFTDSGSDLCH